MITNPVIFYTASSILLIFTFITMFARNIVNALLASIVVFFVSAVFFYILGSEYNAIIQASIYGIAIPIIIGISIMFTTGKKEKNKNNGISYVLLLASAVFVMAFIYIIMISLIILPDTFNILEPVQTSSKEIIFAFSRGIFKNYVWSFELLSLLLTIVIAGLSMHNKKRRL